uniref:Uncharacterized protein n=1 Tax=Sphaerodactylus townsendi TaxID=933632 RepID=A0ACB8EHT1_9SAUR
MAEIEEGDLLEIAHQDPLQVRQGQMRGTAYLRHSQEEIQRDLHLLQQQLADMQIGPQQPIRGGFRRPTLGKKLQQLEPVYRNAVSVYQCHKYLWGQDRGRRRS